MNIQEFFKETTITREDWQRVGLGVGAIVLLTVAFIFLYFFPTKKEIKRLEAELVNKKTQLTEAQQVASKKEMLQKRIESIRAQVKNFEERLPTEKEIPQLLEKFRSMAEEAGIQFVSITAMPIEEKPHYLRIPFRVKMAGNYKALGSFLKDIELGKRFIKIETISITSERKGGSQGLLTLSTFMFSNEEGP